MDLNNNIISFSQDKIWIEKKEALLVVKKITTKKEVNSLIRAKRFLQNKSIVIGNQTYFFNVPSIQDWNENLKTLTMSYCSGDNLETLLRRESSRKYAIPLLEALLKFIINNSFAWVDFAPRNILIDKHTISFVDFEKDLDFKIPNLFSFLRYHIYEEYSSFLLPKERLFQTNKVFSLQNDEVEYYMSVNDIRIKKIKSVATALNYETLSFSEYLNIQKMIIFAQEPFILKNSIIFPRIYLSKILENRHKDPYAYFLFTKIVLTKNNTI